MKLSFSSLTAYRSNFMWSIFSTMVWATFSVVSVTLITSRTANVYGWSRNEILLLTGVYNIIFGLFYMLFSRNFDKFANTVHLGKLDTILTKPVDALFFLSCYYFNYSAIARVLFGVGYSLYVLAVMGIALTPLIIGMFLLFTVLSLMILYSVWCLIVSLTIKWSQLSNLIDLLYTINGVARYPQQMVQGLKYNLLFFLAPITLIVTTPTKLLISKLGPSDFVWLAVTAFGLLALSRAFFNYMVGMYTSAGG